MTETTSIKDQATLVVSRWWTAWVDNDREAIDGLAHPAYDETDESGHFRSLGHADVLAAVEHNRQRGRIEHWRLSDLCVHRVGRLIVCNYVFEIQIQRGSRVVALSGRASDILIQEETGLRYLSHSGSLTETGGRASGRTQVGAG